MAGRAHERRAKIRSRKDGAAIPLDDLDKRLLNLMQGSFPLAPRPYAAVARLAGVSEDEVLRASQRLLDERIIREITPIFDTRALGYSRCSSPPRSTRSNPHRAAQIINAHPGVSHNYLRNHEFNLWFTIAVEPRLAARAATGTLDVLAARDRRRVDPPAADAEAVQDPHGPRDGGRHRGARRAPARPWSRRELEPIPLSTTSTSR